MANNHRKIEENNAWNHLSKWDSLVDERIRNVIGDGDMSWHPKAGQPFEFEDDNVPEEFRLAYKMMKDNDAVPPWIALGYTLRDKHEKIHKRIKHYARDYVARQQKAIQMGSFILHKEADDRWQKAVRQWSVDVGNYNSELLNYNLQVPDSVGQRIPIDATVVAEKALREAQK